MHIGQNQEFMTLLIKHKQKFAIQATTLLPWRYTSKKKFDFYLVIITAMAENAVNLDAFLLYQYMIQKTG